MRRLLAGALLSVALNACGSDTSESSNASLSTPTSASTTSAATSAPTTAPSTTMPDQTYTVAAGDALFAIAEQFCVTADAIVAANGWTDGVNHPLYPGDTLTIPGGGCTSTSTPATTTPGAATTLASGTNKYLQDFLDSSGAFDPFFPGDPGDYDDRFGPVCDAAWIRTWEFGQNRATKADTLTAMNQLQSIGAPAVPANVIATLEALDAFSTTWAPVYDAATARAGAAHDQYSWDYYVALLSDPKYVEFADAYHAIPQSAASNPHAWVNSICTPIGDTANSTP